MIGGVPWKSNKFAWSMHSAELSIASYTRINCTREMQILAEEWYRLCACSRTIMAFDWHLALKIGLGCKA